MIAAAVVMGMLIVGPIGLAAEQPGPRLRNMLVINEDNSHFFGSRKAEEMTVKGLHAWVDQYAGGSVTHLFLCTNAMRSSFRSKSRDAIWDPVNGKEPQHPWPQNARRLHEAGIDPYAVWIARCRKKQLSPWLSMRMNDVHNTSDRSNFQHSTFWRTHIDLWREPNHEHGSGLNYAYAKVREYQLAYVRELLERYDPDGLELDWMRFPNHLTPGKEREERQILTGFVADVRRLTRQWSRKRKHPILLGVRAPAHPDAAAGRGMDAMEWARLGLVDLIVPCPFYFSSDFDIPIEVWREGLKAAPHRVSVVPGLESSVRPWISGTPVGNTMETLYGFAASGSHRGADGVYLFNWMDVNDWPIQANDYRLLITRGVGAKVTARGPRRHPVCFRDTVPADLSMNTQLPADARAGKSFRVHIGPRPKTGRAWIIAGLAKRDRVADARFVASVNGHKIKPTSDLANTKLIGGDAARAVRFDCPLGALKTGYNQITLKQATDTSSQQFVWVEVRLSPTD